MSGSGWKGELELWFACADATTRLVRRRHIGPLAVQRPFYPEDDGSAHVYLLHPPGGVAGGDRLEIFCHLDDSAKAVVTTPGATKFYRSDSDDSVQNVKINVGRGAVCEYLPQETILFGGSKVSVSTEVALKSDSVYLGWEIFSFGRPAAGEDFAAGRVRQRVTIMREGVPVYYERFDLAAGTALLHDTYAFAGRPIMGTMIYAGPVNEDMAERVRAALGEAGLGVFSVSALERVVVCRYLGTRMSECKTLFGRAWDVIREIGLGKRSVAPRIWAT
ncbi:urease accessory protein UreD [Brucella sp. TWI432]